MAGGEIGYPVPFNTYCKAQRENGDRSQYDGARQIQQDEARTDRSQDTDAANNPAINSVKQVTTDQSAEHRAGSNEAGKSRRTTRFMPFFNKDGHEIGNHSWSHPFMDRLGDRSALQEVDRTTDVIFQVTGRPPVTFRPPYGAFTRRQRTWLNAHRRLPTILWSVDPQDWRRPGAATVSNRILRASHQGAIILSHDIHRGTIDAMPQTLDGLTARGLHFVTVSQILGWPLWQSRNFRRVVQSG